MDLHKESTAELFGKIMSIITESNCLTYKIMGYKFVSQRLILYYDDCARVCDFNILIDWDAKTYKVEPKKPFYTKNYVNFDERLKQMKRFKREIEFEKPE